MDPRKASQLLCRMSQADQESGAPPQLVGGLPSAPGVPAVLVCCNLRLASTPVSAKHLNGTRSVRVFRATPPGLRDCRISKKLSVFPGFDSHKGTGLGNRGWLGRSKPTPRPLFGQGTDSASAAREAPAPGSAQHDPGRAPPSAHLSLSGGNFIRPPNKTWAVVKETVCTHCFYIRCHPHLHPNLKAIVLGLTSRKPSFDCEDHPEA